ncbi:ADP-heptose--lipooligosaccharide heptosyltransferase II [uncultured Candidatus Thioglobus sp.]|nr:ADP-heptose--lipooligosaccharide heptosyltransferase II [uncultured Candidatus Thioglobus sp.]
MNILITRHDKIGDFITTLPLFYVVKKHHPTAKIYALVSKINFELAQQVDFIDEVILYEKNHFWIMFKQLRAAKINTSISAFIDTRLGWLLFLSGIKTRIAPATKLAQLFFNKTLKQRRSRVEKTEFEYNLDLAKILNKDIDLSFDTPLLKLEKNTDFRVKQHLGDKKIVLLHPGYGGSSDGNLPLSDYIKLAKTVSEIDNIQAVWTFGPDDLEGKKQLQEILPKALIYQPPTLLDFCQLINDSNLLISTSTGPMHLAGALNINTISFFGNNLFASQKRWATVSNAPKQHNVLVDNADFEEIKVIMLKICD